MHSVFLQPSQTQQLPVPPCLGQKTLKLREEKKTGFTCALFLLDLSLIQAVNLSGCTFLKEHFLVCLLDHFTMKGELSCLLPGFRGLHKTARRTEHFQSYITERWPTWERGKSSLTVSTVYTALVGISHMGDLEGSAFSLDSRGILRIYRQAWIVIILLGRLCEQ